MRQRAADRAAVARLEMPDPRQRTRQQRRDAAQLGPAHQLVLRHRRADLELVTDELDRLEILVPADIDQHTWLHEPQVHHRHQRLPAGQHARVLTVLGQHRHRLLDRLGPHVVELSRLHPSYTLHSSLPPCGGGAPQGRRGVCGASSQLAAASPLRPFAPPPPQGGRRSIRDLPITVHPPCRVRTVRRAASSTSLSPVRHRAAFRTRRRIGRSRSAPRSPACARRRPPPCRTPPPRSRSRSACRCRRAPAARCLTPTPSPSARRSPRRCAPARRASDPSA